MPVSARTGSPRRPARRPRGRMRPRVHEGELQLKLQLEVIHKGAEARQLTCAVHRRAALWDLGRSFLDGGRCVWTAIRICPVTVTKSMSWPSQRVIGFAGHRPARSAPNPDSARAATGKLVGVRSRSRGAM